MKKEELSKRELQKLKDASFFDEEILCEIQKDMEEELAEKERTENKRIIDKKTSDYNLLTLNKILKKREEDKKLLSLLKKKNMELDVFYKLITKADDLSYSVEELYRIYKSILDSYL